jgi:hypothetical protein
VKHSSGVSKSFDLFGWLFDILDRGSRVLELQAFDVDSLLAIPGKLKLFSSGAGVNEKFEDCLIIYPFAQLELSFR